MEKLALASLLLLFAVDLLQLQSGIVATVALVAAMAHGLRLLLWRSWRTLAVPLVWIRAIRSPAIREGFDVSVDSPREVTRRRFRNLFLKLYFCDRPCNSAQYWALMPN